MTLEAPILMVRHGEYDYRTGSLIYIGREQAGRAAGEIVTTYGFGPDAVILASDAGRTVETAKVIKEKVGGERPILESPLLRMAGNYPANIRSLDTLLGDEWAAYCVEGDIATRGLVVVTHGPLIAAARGMAGADLDGAALYGGVYPYTPGSWVNPIEQLGQRFNRA